MKKIFIPILLALCFAACNSNDRLIDQYQQSMQNQDYGKAREILSKIDYDDLTYEQQMRINDISTGGAASAFADELMKSMQQVGKALNNELNTSRFATVDDHDGGVLDDGVVDYESTLDGLMSE